MKIESFTDLNAWKEGHKLVLFIYRLTKSFPSEEKFGLIDQMRRCAVSITSNIAEGFSRKSSKEKSQFYYMALGSVTEFQNQLIISRDVEYLSKTEFQKAAEQTITVSKLVNGLIKSSRKLNT
jgi:four helix bundle protein